MMITQKAVIARAKMCETNLDRVTSHSRLLTIIVHCIYTTYGLNNPLAWSHVHICRSTVQRDSRMSRCSYICCSSRHSHQNLQINSYEYYEFSFIVLGGILSYLWQLGGCLYIFLIYGFYHLTFLCNNLYGFSALVGCWSSYFTRRTIYKFQNLCPFDYSAFAVSGKVGIP